MLYRFTLPYKNLAPTSLFTDSSRPQARCTGQREWERRLGVIPSFPSVPALILRCLSCCCNLNSQLWSQGDHATLPFIPYQVGEVIMETVSVHFTQEYSSLWRRISKSPGRVAFLWQLLQWQNRDLVIEQSKPLLIAVIHVTSPTGNFTFCGGIHVRRVKR